MSIEIKTLSILYDAIEDDYKWRITELSNFRNSTLSEKNIKVQKAQIRAGVALLYAHWEGFIKHASNLYYEYVRNQSLVVEELNDSFIGILLRGELNLLQTSNKLKDHKTVIKTIIDEKTKKANFSSTVPIKTANLKYEVFEDVCILLGINLDEFEQRCKVKYDRNIKRTIDDDLVGQRNSIAHGEYLSIKLEDYKTLYEIIINGFLYNFKEIVMDCAANKKYLRNYVKA